MLLTFTKRDGKFDYLRVERDGVASETIRCPKQGILPHVSTAEQNPATVAV